MAQDKLLEIEECIQMLLQEVAALPVSEVAILETCGRVLAEDVAAMISVPPYSKSAMDGYAVCSADLCGVDLEHPVKFPVIGRLMAGDYEEIPYRKNTAVRVMTGAFIPAGYDCVVRQEDTNYGEEEVEIYTTLEPYQNYCKQGEDIKEGQSVLSKGTRLTPLHIGLLAEIGREKVQVYQPVRVAILCTGSELVNVGQPLLPGKIYNNISYILASELKKEGMEVVFQQLCEDEKDVLAVKLQEALNMSDVVITTGGVSVGQKDLVPEVLAEIGAKILFRRANIQPGTPTTGSVKDGKIILSLSGNPYAAMVNFDIYFWEIAAKMMNSKELGSIKKTAILKTPYDRQNKGRRFLRANYKDGEVTLPSSTHASSVISNMTECNCYIDLEPGRKPEVGETVRVWMSRSVL